MPGLGDKVTVVEATEQGMMLHRQPVRINAEQLAGQGVLLHAVVVIQARLRSPAVVQNGKCMILGPLDIIRQFLPVIHIFKFITFHRRACNDKAVIILVFDIGEFQIRLVQIGIIRMRGFS